MSQAIEAMPEISGDNNLAQPDGLAPEMFMGREVKCCRHCHLNQFVTQNGMCRKCRHSMIPEPQPIPDVQPVATFEDKLGARCGMPPRTRSAAAKIDIGFAVKLLRVATGLSQSELAKRGFFRTYISKVENGTCVPTVSLILRLALALDVTPHALVTIAEAACAA